ncbi:hypothetical protein [Amycolatopsis sp. 195334CR]|uniref:hypothetical protein n=1 Tax=Amycolatopsis sp. 195334CR TaxID=2814588 RepID=UPI001A8C7796|nr:hypothetical protein [Amycolatopsis sp. 195334CR]MBN6037462.1 hypothetical protein [Amycolatopsis sp. 195334CR]
MIVRTGADLITLSTETPKWTDIGSFAVAAAALLIASVAAWATIRTNRNQSEQLRRLEATQASELASKFGVWISSKPAEEYEPDSGDHVGSSTQFYFEFQNSGFLPIYNLVVYCDLPHLIHPTTRQERLRWSFATIAPTPTRSQLDDNDRLNKAMVYEVVAFRERYRFASKDELTIEMRNLRRLIQGDIKSGMEYLSRQSRIGLFFTDGNGLHWHRSHDGTLTQLEKAGDLATTLAQKSKREKRRDRKRTKETPQGKQ